MTKRITIQTGDYILLSDIPNEQVFNLVKECFVNAGFNDIDFCGQKLAKYNERSYWTTIIATKDNVHCFGYVPEKDDYNYPTRQLSLSDVFNSVNGDFYWKGFSSCVVYKTNCVYTNSGSSGLYTEDAHIATIERILYWNNKPDTYKITKAFDLNDLQRMSIESVQGRALGKSTAHHLELISKAMKNPEQWVKVYSDHDNLQRHHRFAFEEVRSLCHKLGLDWMEFSVSLNSIRYMPYQTVKMVTKWEVIA